LAAGLDALRKELREDIAGAVRELSGLIGNQAGTRRLHPDVMKGFISRIEVLGEGRS
jgi:hypothetical protein